MLLKILFSQFLLSVFYEWIQRLHRKEDMMVTIDDIETDMRTMLNLLQGFSNCIPD